MASAASPFLSACSAGNLALARQLGAGSSAVDARLALCDACRDGHLEVAQWLASHFGLTATDARAVVNVALRDACRNGHLGVAQWLASHFGLTAADARADDNAALRAACSYGHLELAQWLAAHFGLTAADARAVDDHALRWSCENNHREVARWVVAAAEYSVEELTALENIWCHLLPDLAKEVQALGPKSLCTINAQVFALPFRAALCGPALCGKTTAAMKFCHERGSCFDRIVVWAREVGHDGGREWDAGRYGHDGQLARAEVVLAAPKPESFERNANVLFIVESGINLSKDANLWDLARLSGHPGVSLIILTDDCQSVPLKLRGLCKCTSWTKGSRGFFLQEN